MPPNYFFGVPNTATEQLNITVGYIYKCIKGIYTNIFVGNISNEDLLNIGIYNYYILNLRIIYWRVM